MAEPFKIHNLDGEGYFDVSKHPDTLRIEVYWKGKSRWVMIADMGSVDIMIEEAARATKSVVTLIALGGTPDHFKG